MNIPGADGLRPEAPGSGRVLLGVAALLFAASSAVTVAQCAAMSAMAGVQMPGGWMLSMAWTRMPGQSWGAAFGAFLVMWVAMMGAMMLPSLTPALQRYRHSVGRLDLALLAGLGYFAVSAALGATVFPLGAALAALQMHWPYLAQAAPAAAGGVVIVAGLVQLTRWKAHHLECCRRSPGRCIAPAAGPRSAWRSGVRLGLHCSCCCAPQMAVLLVIGVMDLRAMALVSGAITVERLLPAGPRIARGAGVVAVVAGALVLAHAASLV